MSGYKVRFTTEAELDLLRLYDFLLEIDITLAERALEAVKTALSLLELSPFSCRKAMANNAFIREMVIPFGRTGYVALFEIDDAKTVTILALRHQREEDYL